MIFFTSLNAEVVLSRERCKEYNVVKKCVDLDFGAEKKIDDSPCCICKDNSYNKLQKIFETVNRVEYGYLMNEPYSELKRILQEWYRKGVAKNTFPFYRHFRQMTDELGLESEISLRMWTQRLQEMNLRPLYDPQIALIDPQKRIREVKKILRKKFSHIEAIEADETPTAVSENEERTPIDRIDFEKYSEYFTPFIRNDLELYEAIRKGEIVPGSRVETKRKRKKKKEESTQRKRSNSTPIDLSDRIDGRVAKITRKALSGWILLKEPYDKPLRLVLKVNGKREKRKQITLKNKVGKRVRFEMTNLSLKRGDEIELQIQPGGYRIKFSKTAQRFLQK